MPNVITKLSIYKCPLCGNIIEVLTVGGGELVCCGQPMQLLTENTVDASKEKHVPVIEKIDWGWKVKVGSVAHPMLEEHWIQFIELIADNRVYRAQLSPGDAPEATFYIQADSVTAREHCNLHGLWEASNS